VLAGSAALRAGAGLVTVACPEPVWNQVAVGNVCYTTKPLPADAAGRFAQAALPDLIALAEKNDVVALGPGLGQSADITALVAGLLAQTARPMVVDADGLNALQGQIESLVARQAPLILTPHPGEFGRLIGQSPGAVQARREELAVAFAQAHRVVLVLKGRGTLVTDGHRLYRSDTGNPGMATGGTGDVLSGTIAALVGQGLTAFEAAQLGVHVHGRAGDLARAELGEISLIASDLLNYLPRAFRAI
jgi:NAD(P)H-hydrate epimerase